MDEVSNKVGGLTIVMPAHNEEIQIAESIKRLLQGSYSEPVFLVVVDDGSTDQTAEIVRSLSLPNLRLISYQPNGGKGHALQVGTMHIETEFGAYFDSDLDLHPKGIELGLDTLKKSGDLVMVVGSKVHKDSNVEYPYLRKVLSWVYRAITRMAFNFRVSDTQTGLKVFRTKEIKIHSQRCESKGWTYDLELIARLSSHGNNISEIPVDLDFQFTSKMSPREAFAALRDTIDVFRRLD